MVFVIQQMVIIRYIVIHLAQIIRQMDIMRYIIIKKGLVILRMDGGLVMLIPVVTIIHISAIKLIVQMLVIIILLPLDIMLKSQKATKLFWDKLVMAMLQLLLFICLVMSVLERRLLLLLWMWMVARMLLIIWMLAELLRLAMMPIFMALLLG